jgi:L-ectoine synthase
MIIRTLAETRRSTRNVKGKGWVSARLALKDDDMGFSFHVTTMFAGREISMHYKNHLEAVFILRGEGTIEDLATNEVHDLRPGTLYLLNDHDRHVVRPRTDILAACVFNPPVSGREVHDDSGSYPAEMPAEPVPIAQ